MYTPPIKGKFLKKKLLPAPTGQDFINSVSGVATIVFELNQLKQDVTEQVDAKIEEVDSALQDQIDKMVDTAQVLKSTQAEAIELIKETKVGPPGKDADPHKMLETLAAMIPEPLDLDDLTAKILAKVPKIDEKAFTKKILEAIPKNKASLKIIQEKFEVDPMSVIDKIMAMPQGKFKLKTENIDGLEQTMSAFRSQLGRGYLHGGGASLLTQLNDVTITSPTDGQALVYDAVTGKWINGAGGGSGGITRQIFSISSDTNAGSTSQVDYVYLVSGTTTLTLPTAVSNTNRYTVKNVGSDTVTIDTTSGETIDGSASAQLLVANTSLDFISDNSNWFVI